MINRYHEGGMSHILDESLSLVHQIRLPGELLFTLQYLLRGYKDVQLRQCFKNGFSIHFLADVVSPTSTSRKPDIVDAIWSKELGKGRITVPFDSEPFANFRTSPTGLKPKRIKGRFRLILSSVVSEEI